MKNANVSTNTPAGKYLPKDGVSSEATAAFMFPFHGATLCTGPAVSPFADVEPRDKFFSEITWLESTGLSTGIKQPSGKLAYVPKPTVTREAIAAFLYRFEGQ